MIRKQDPGSLHQNGEDREGREDNPGTGAWCADAQADGVPCFEIGIDCEICKKAVISRRNRESKEVN